ncbi:MAG: 2-oxoglutarate dehydrogenase complex dihydrolipoyllysine-residue succinyltransferase [Waddliaceae bacterium]
MTKVEIKVPAMGESITEATIGAILKPTGTPVKIDDEILELETDKVNQVLYAQADGVVNLNVQADETVTIDQVIGHIDSEGAASEPKAKEQEAKPKPEVQEPEVKKEVPAGGALRISKEEFLNESPKTEVAQKSEPTATQSKETSPPPKTVEKPIFSSTSGREESRQKMSKIRKVIAKRLVESQHSTAMLTTFNEVDMSAVMELRSRYKDAFEKKHGIKLGFMSFFVQACVFALREVPQVNSYIEGEELVNRHYYDIGIAVGTERGLVVPVVRNCDKLSSAQIEQSIVNYAEKARKGGLSVDDLQGGGFTITNGGIYGSLLSTPILNPPQSGILGMHKIEKRPVVVDDEIVIRPMMYLAMSYDHRVIDGKEAVTFLVRVKQALEDPSRLIIGV